MVVTLIIHIKQPMYYDVDFIPFTLIKAVLLITSGGRYSMQPTYYQHNFALPNRSEYDVYNFSKIDNNIVNRTGMQHKNIPYMLWDTLTIDDSRKCTLYSIMISTYRITYKVYVRQVVVCESCWWT